MKVTPVRTNLVFIAIFFLSVAGFFSVIAATRWGIGISPDSAVYIVGARNLAAGRGFSIQTNPGISEGITHHAPLYPMLLSIVEVIGIDTLLGARLLNATFFSVSIFLVGAILHRFIPLGTTASFWFPVLGSFLMLSSFVLIDIHAMAWTEPSFIFFSLLGLYWLGLYLDNSPYRYFALAALAVGLSALTRYAGLAVIATCIVGNLLFNHHSLKKKLRSSLLFGLLSTLPLVVWLGINWIVSGTATNRELAFHPITFGHMTGGLTTIASWFLIPETVSGYIKILPVLLFLLLVAVFLVLRSPGRIKWVNLSTVAPDSIPASLKLFALFIPVYLGFLAGSITFLDANTPLDSRILSPVYVFSLIWIIYCIAQLWVYVEGIPSAQAGIALICLFWVGIFTFGGGAYIGTAYEQGRGFNSAVWHRSEIISEVSRIPESQVIYSNAPEAIYIHTGRWVFGLPKEFESVTQKPNDQYPLEIDQMALELKNTSGVIVYFNQIFRPTLPTEDELTHQLPLVNYIDRNDGVIYRLTADQ